MTMTPQLFAQAGEALFGPEWKQPLADLIGMNVRTVRRIAAAAREGEDYPVNESLGPTLAEHLQTYITEKRADLARAEQLMVLLRSN